MAIAAMVMGICGLVICPLILSIPAIVFGAIAMRDIDRNPERLDGKGMAIAGLVTGIVGTTLSVILIIVAIAIGIAEENDTNKATTTTTRDRDATTTSTESRHLSQDPALLSSDL